MEDEKDERKKDVSPRPIRPFLTGLAVAASWGAINMPADITTAALEEFFATIVAIALITGGGLAMVIEAVKLAVRYGRERFRT
jgi:hypothetical protein